MIPDALGSALGAYGKSVISRGEGFICDQWMLLVDRISEHFLDPTCEVRPVHALN